MIKSAAALLNHKQGMPFHSKGQRFSERTKDLIFLFFIISPAMAMLIFTIGIPMVKSLYMSLFNVSLLSMHTYEWNSFNNYKNLFADGEFAQAMKVTLIYVLSVVFIQFILGILLAVILNGQIRFKKTIRTLILIPWVIPTIVGALLWMWLFQPQYGVINYILTSLHITSEPYSWLSSMNLALPAVMLVALWKQLPFMSTMLLAGMQGISEDMYEAAMIDGASKRQQFFHITLPMLKNTIKTVTLISCIENFKMFPLFWIMTNGGPLDRTTTLAIFSYKTAFIKLDLGQGAAIGVLWLLNMLAFAWTYNQLFSFGEDKEATAT